MWAFTVRELSRVARVWKQTLIAPVVTSVLFILVFGYSLGSRISDISGVTYLEFLIPGLAMMGIITSAYTNASSSLYIAKFQKNVQEVLVAPLSYWQIIGGLTIASVIRSMIVGFAILAVGFAFVPLTITSVWSIIFFSLVVSLTFAFAGIATALWADSFDEMSVFSTFIISPLTYLGGVFYSISMLPALWQDVALFNPMLYMVDGFRYGFFGVADVPVLRSAITALVFAAVFFVLCMEMLRRGYKLRT